MKIGVLLQSNLCLLRRTFRIVVLIVFTTSWLYTAPHFSWLHHCDISFLELTCFIPCGVIQKCGKYFNDKIPSITLTKWVLLDSRLREIVSIMKSQLEVYAIFSDNSVVFCLFIANFFSNKSSGYVNSFQPIHSAEENFHRKKIIEKHFRFSNR